MRRWTLIPIIIMVCGALAAGCSSSGNAKGAPTPSTVASGPTAGPAGVAAPLNQLMHVALSTTMVSSVHFTMRLSLHGEDQPSTVSVVGVYDMEHSTGTQDVTLSSGPVRLIHEILAPQHTYFSTKDAAKGPWSSIGRADVQLRHLLRPPGNDPKYPLVQLKSITDVAKKGTGPLDGLDDVTHYSGMIPLATMLQDAASDRRDHLAAILAAQPKSQTPVDVWIDKNGRLTRLTETISAASKGFSGTLTIDVSAYGIAVNSTTPKKSTPVKVDALPTNLLG